MADETNETERIRKRAVHAWLILATQDEAGPAAAEVIQWLLTAFPPLKLSLTQDAVYDLGNEARVGRAREHKGDKVLLVIGQKFVESLLPKDQEDNGRSGKK